MMSTLATETAETTSNSTPAMDTKGICTSTDTATIKPISLSSDLHGDSNFPQGCQISPDGLCVLTSTAADNFLRLYNIPPITTNESTCTDADDTGAGNNDDNTMIEQSNNPVASSPCCPSWQTSLYAREGDSVRSYCWYPLMNSYHPPSCAFLSCSR